MPLLMRLALMAIMLIMFSPAFAADQTEPPRDYADIIDHFYSLLEEKEGAEAVDWLFSTNPYSDRLPDALVNIKSQFSSLEASIGSYIDNHLLIDKEISSRYVFRYYLVDYDRQPLIFKFHFYRPKDRWQVQNFFFVANVSADIETFAKYNLLDQ